MILEHINQPNDIKNVNKKDYPVLAQEIRDFLVAHISETGGHLASNLGSVELTMALHLSLDLPKDKIIWDVGHQSYTHKLLTGRKEGFDTLRKLGGMSGFPKRKESECDCFDTGHSSTSISAGLGFVKARDLAGEDYTVVSVIGDGSLTGGMAYEAMNNATDLDTNFIVVLNDNKMSISENVGGVSKYLNNIRTTEGYLELKEDIYNRLMKTKNGVSVVGNIRKAKNKVKSLVIPGMFFEDMGFTYLGPVDGHDMNALLKVMKEAKRCRGAVLVHVMTEKGKGYEPAKRHPARFHGAEPFDINSGVPKHMRSKANYTDIFSTVMCKMGERKEKVLAITAAMPDGTGLKRFRNRYPQRFFDVGIAEQHAVTFAAGLAAGGFHPVVAIYSSFLQRAYDQILHDVCIQDLPVTFAIDRAGLVGSDGETHQGIFDLSYLSNIPGMTVMAPKNKWELADMLEYSCDFAHPIALRYPRGEAYDGLREYRSSITYGKSEIIYRETEVALLAVGSMVKTAVEVHEKLTERGIPCTLVNARFVKPIDTEMLDEVMKDHTLIVPMEENVASGAYGEQVLTYLESRHYPGEFYHVCIPDAFIPHGSVDLLKKELHMDADSIVDEIVKRRRN
ncbi:MAG: 1-deoxy-D-xylulose-5-phosphate synthase [Lachnospiraceae bacterium]